MNSFVLLFSVLSCIIAVHGFNPVINQCGNRTDGFYECRYLTSASFEPPSNLATNWNFGDANFNSLMVTLQFNPNPFNKTQDRLVFFDSDFAVRSYEDGYAAWSAGIGNAEARTGSVKSYEYKGNTTKTRRAVFTWTNFFNVNQGSFAFNVQIKLFQNGNIEYHYKNFTVSGSETALVGLEFNSATVYHGDFPIYFGTSVTLTNVAYGFYISEACGTDCVVQAPFPASNYLLPPAQFCLLPHWNPDLIGYFCKGTEGFFMCFSGVFTQYSMALNCAPGTFCRCDPGVECSENNLVSPCTF